MKEHNGANYSKWNYEIIINIQLPSKEDKYQLANSHTAHFLLCCGDIYVVVASEMYFWQIYSTLQFNKRRGTSRSLSKAPAVNTISECGSVHDSLTDQAANPRPLEAKHIQNASWFWWHVGEQERLKTGVESLETREEEKGNRMTTGRGEREQNDKKIYVTTRPFFFFFF